MSITNRDIQTLKNSTWKDFDIDTDVNHPYLESEIIFNKLLSFDLSEYFTVDMVYIQQNPPIVQIDGMWLDDELRGLGIGFKTFEMIARTKGMIYENKSNMSTDGKKLFEKLSKKPEFKVVGLKDSTTKDVIVIYKR